MCLSFRPLASILSDNHGWDINEDPLLSSLDSSSYITKAVDPAHRHWYAVAIDKLYTVSK